jgi:hypothetical protein
VQVQGAFLCNFNPTFRFWTSTNLSSAMANGSLIWLGFQDEGDAVQEACRASLAGPVRLSWRGRGTLIH